MVLLMHMQQIVILTLYERGAQRCLVALIPAKLLYLVVCALRENFSRLRSGSLNLGRRPRLFWVVPSG